jgi:NTP pyrophosphatase (non-canonical NTP hydrolase)
MKYIEYKKLAPRTLSNVVDMYGEMNVELEKRLQSLHCVIGIHGEIYELITATDEVNAKEEIGDAMWFVANYEEIQGYEKFDDLNFENDLKYVDTNILNDLTSEFLDLWKKKVFYNSNKYDERIESLFFEIKKQLVKYVNKLEFDINSIMKTNIEKLQERYPEKFNTKDADNRNLNKERDILERM